MTFTVGEDDEANTARLSVTDSSCEVSETLKIILSYK